VQVLIEPINTARHPRLLPQPPGRGARHRAGRVGAANLKVQMDLYHCQIVEGDLAMKIRQYLPTGGVGHIQIAGVPERHEPDLGELHHPYLFELLDRLGYEGWIGCEYRPARGAVPGGTRDGLGWMRPYLTP
jgi:hydroxypyruvate isomerase